MKNERLSRDGPPIFRCLIVLVAHVGCQAATPSLTPCVASLTLKPMATAAILISAQGDDWRHIPWSTTWAFARDLLR